MNVLLIPSSFPTRREPWPANYIYEYARSLALQHEVTVLYPQHLGSPGVGNEPFFIEEMLEPGIRLVNYTYSYLPKTWLLSYLWAFRKVFRRIRREWEIDIIYAHVVLPAGPAALLLGKLFHIPVILTEHWGPPEDWLKESSAPRKLVRTVIANTYRQVDYLTAVSKSLASEIEEVFGASADATMEQPIDCDVFYPAATPLISGQRRVLCVTRGKYDPRKGVSNLLNAWKVVSRRTCGSATLDIVGPDIEELAPQIEAADIVESCRLISWKSGSELAALMRASSLVVIPSSYETFGRSGAEALACGVPVVSTRCGGPNEYVEEGTGLLVPPEEPEALAAGILAGLERRNFLPPEELARRIRDRFGYEAVCRRFTETAGKLTNSNSAQNNSAEL
jgi:glycosyltransferase involved in cell wall biosynthesis